MSSPYYKSDVTIVFKTSARSNAKTKMKTFRNKTIDEILTKKLPGVPDIAVVVELGIGEGFEEQWKKKYKLL
jgi:hypothetical protein